MEEELNISNLIDSIKKWFFLILLLMIIGGGIAIIYNYGAPVKYQSKSTLYVEPSVTSSVVDYQGILTNQKMVKTYAEIIKSRRIVNKVIEALNLNLTYEELLSEVSVTSETDTQIITIIIKDSNSTRAANIANTFAEILISDLAESMDITNIKVIDEAIATNIQVEPKKTLNIIIGIMGGCMVGLLFTFILESMDNKIKTHDDIKKYLKIKTLGIVPLNSIDSEIKSKKKKKKKYLKITETSKANIKILTDPNSIVSESIRMIRTNLDFADLKLINVTSTMPSEGKSEFITNIAVSFAMLDKKVLVVDCDLRKPKVHRNFGKQRGTGVSDILLSKGALNYRSALQRFESNDVYVDILSAGSMVSNPSELINSTGFANLLRELRDDYDLVLLDCPPISNLTDGVLVSKLADGTVYVIESNRLDYTLVSNCIDDLQSNKAFILGAILTKVDVKKEKKIYGYKYDYYYSNYNK
ncbi:MAG: polysaccharide biosynthesis tyrosine autokinase [Bacilli bacterium]|nr:polysaccharide biosynthesis tyrosine autokinase [Bacilli bacterium]